ncbi:MAG: hypothetical protein P4L49_01580 [Desulfosporosinus sp.]|nr:hypothetical protein [Desulfosporosinus sp.]
MDKKTYLAFSTDERAYYLNEQMIAGSTLKAACQSAGIGSENIAKLFRDKGFIRNDKGLFVTAEQMADQTKDAVPQTQDVILTEGMITPTTENNPIVGSDHGEGQAIEEQPQGGVSQPLEVEPITIPPTVFNNPVVDIPTRQQGQKRLGRPRREGGEVIKLTIELTVETHRALMIYRAANNLFANQFIEKLLKENIPERYFNPL